MQRARGCGYDGERPVYCYVTAFLVAPDERRNPPRLSRWRLRRPISLRLGFLHLEQSIDASAEKFTIDIGMAPKESRVATHTLRNFIMPQPSSDVRLSNLAGNSPQGLSGRSDVSAAVPKKGVSFRGGNSARRDVSGKTVPIRVGIETRQVVADRKGFSPLFG